MKNPPLPIPRTRKSILATITKKNKKSPTKTISGHPLSSPPPLSVGCTFPSPNHRKLVVMKFSISSFFLPSVITPDIATPAIAPRPHIPPRPTYHTYSWVHRSCRTTQSTGSGWNPRKFLSSCSSHTRPLGDEFYSLRCPESKSAGSSVRV
ncbi:hypothetical protein K440DRAFT_358919 [Wilcoxina mikolae CBS 423.85]|nr:hypothetical protein K440DRAFT_358919 [Wilcoxina mikolae CBS 423.85]